MGKIDFIEVSNPDSIGVVAALADKIWNEHYRPIIGQTQVDYMLEKFQSTTAIAEQIKNGFLYFLLKNADNHYIGYIGVATKGNHLLLSKIYVEAENRGKGYGKQSIHFVENLAREKGLAKIILTVNKNNLNSIKAYRKCGFNIVGQIVQDIGNGFIMDDYKMEKPLIRQDSE